MFTQLFMIIIMCIGILTYDSNNTDDTYNASWSTEPKVIKYTHELLIRTKEGAIILSKRVFVYKKIDIWYIF